MNKKIIYNQYPNGTLVFQCIGLNEVYFLNEVEETAALCTAEGQLIKQWDNIYEFREDYSSDCFPNDIEMLKAEYELKLNFLLNNCPIDMNSKEFNLDHDYTEALAQYSLVYSEIFN